MNLVCIYLFELFRLVAFCYYVVMHPVDILLSVILSWEALFRLDLISWCAGFTVNWSQYSRHHVDNLDVTPFWLLYRSVGATWVGS